jgi:thymidylate kinase
MTLMLIEFLQQLGKSVREMLVSDEVIISQRSADASAARRQIQDGIPVAFH